MNLDQHKIQQMHEESQPARATVSSWPFFSSKTWIVMVVAVIDVIILNDIEYVRTQQVVLVFHRYNRVDNQDVAKRDE